LVLPETTDRLTCSAWQGLTCATLRFSKLRWTYLCVRLWRW